ncbi:MFS transporter [Promethearchaeum syntrophicum]|uniref:MFS transporter n=1 Tax=Promethearchaeum syntrophicum TaxID=2594042 RepID=A0A5B9D5M8_9ARCH|nr:MFS transporter [Candidatus Prometheoarchaeum syntrophicum]
MAEDRMRSKGYMSFLIIFMGLIALLDNYLSLIETDAVGYIIAEFGMTLPEFTLWQGIFGIAAFLVFILSWFADLWGRKIGILILVLVMSVSALLIGLIGDISVWIFFILYAILILGTNVNLWTIPISEESPAKNRAINGSVAFLIGLIPLYAVIGIPIAENLGWTWMYGLFGIFGLVILVMWFFMKETKRWETDRADLKTRMGNYKESVKLLNKRDWLFVIISGAIYIFWNTSFKMMTTTVSIYFQDVIGLDAETWTSSYTFAGLSTILGALTIGIIMEKLGRIFALIYCSLGAAISILGLAFVYSPVFLILTYFFMASFLGFLLVYITEMFATKIRATGLGLALTLSRIGYVVGPLLGTALLPDVASAATLGTFQMYYVVAAVIILLPLLSFIWNKYETKSKTLETIQEEVKE